MATFQDEKGAPGLDLALSKLGLAPRPGTESVNFCTPQNQDFYSKYQYRPLNRKRRHIRLLKVFPAEKTVADHLVDHPHWKASVPPQGKKSGPRDDEKEVLACEMIDGVPLSACAGQYLTLSYAAGDPERTAAILVDGVLFNAFARLVHALNCALDYWQRKDGNRGDYLVLWVDQICINQSDPEERSHQVMMMRDIYSHCETTLVCLSVNRKTRNGLEWLNETLRSTSLVDVFWDNCFEDKHYVRGSVPSYLASFLAFLRCPWWTRSWVYQEFVCSPEVHFLFGDRDASWENMSACLTTDLVSWCEVWTNRLASEAHLERVRSKREEHSEKRAQEPAQDLNEVRRRIKMKQKSDLDVEVRFGNLVKELSARDVQQSMRTVAAMVDGRSKFEGRVGDLRILLQHSRNFQASDPRDKVYAFVGLARDDYKFEPDYSPENNVVHVYSDAARRILEYDGDLTYLLEQAFVGRRDLGLLLPSWVADWNCYEDRRVLQELQEHFDKSDSSGSSRRSPGIDHSSGDKKLGIDPLEKEERSSLRVMGRRVATLAQKWKSISPHLRQFETDSGVVVYTPHTARPKNEIWSLSGCQWLVVLRCEDAKKYCFGGFVVIRGFEDKTSSKGGDEEVFLI